MGKLRVLSLFAGIGGFDLGLERTGGFKTVRLVEQKPHAQAVLAKNFPGVRCDDDVTTCEYEEGEADVIAAGFPCQDISFAGDGAGLAGARSGLYREVIRALRMVRPRFAVLENVAALLSRGLGTVLGDVAAVGYDAEWHCIPASAVGARHRRDRIWIVAHARGEQHEGGRAPLSGTLAAELLEAALANASDGGYGHDHGSGENPGKAGAHQGEGHQRERLRSITGGGGALVADAEGDGQPFCWPWDEGRNAYQAGEQSVRIELGRDRASDRAGDIADADRARLSVAGAEPNGADGWDARRVPTASGWWTVEPNVGRVAHGVPSRVDRLAELGNAVVPQIPEIIGRAILASLEREAA